MNQIADVLKELATRLGTTAEHLYGVLVKQAGVEVAIVAVGFLLWGLVTFGAWKLLSYARKNWEEIEDRDNEPFWAVGGCIGGIVYAVFTLCLWIDGILNLPTLLLNPEYYAIHKIMSAISGS